MAQTPPFTFEIKPETTLDMGRPVTLQARWTRSRPPGWVITFQYRRDANSPWITVHATRDAGELLRDASGQLVDYVCDSGDCQLVVNPHLTQPTRLEFRTLAQGHGGQSLASADIIPVQWVQPVMPPPPPPPPPAVSRLTFTLATNGVPCQKIFELPLSREAPAALYCRSPLDGPAAANSARITAAADGSVPEMAVLVTWTGFQNLPWGWQVQINYGDAVTRCPGAAGQCQYTIPARPAGWLTGDYIGRTLVIAALSWDNLSGANPGTAPPTGFHFSGFNIEQTIDYMR